MLWGYREHFALVLLAQYHRPTSISVPRFYKKLYSVAHHPRLLPIMVDLEPILLFFPKEPRCIFFRQMVLSRQVIDVTCRRRGCRGWEHLAHTPTPLQSTHQVLCPHHITSTNPTTIGHSQPVSLPQHFFCLLLLFVRSLIACPTCFPPCKAREQHSHKFLTSPSSSLRRSWCGRVSVWFPTRHPQL